VDQPAEATSAADPATTVMHGTGLSALSGSVGFFNFLKLLIVVGYQTQAPRLIALTEVVFATTSVMTMINHNL